MGLQLHYKLFIAPRANTMLLYPEKINWSWLVHEGTFVDEVLLIIESGMDVYKKFHPCVPLWEVAVVEGEITTEAPEQ